MTRARGSRPPLLLAVVLAIAFAAPARAQDAAPASGDAPPKATELVRFTAPAPVALTAGGSASAKLAFHVPAPWHVNAHKPNEDFLVPTVLTLQPAGGVSMGAAAYPSAKQAKLSFSETPLAVYEGDFTITAPLTATAAATPGAHTLKGTLRFQACDDQVCLPPATIPVTVEVNVAAGAARETTAAAPDTAATAAAASPPAGPSADTQPGTVALHPPVTAPSANLVTRWFEERGSLLAFVLIFLMGLALNLTPCVYPMMGVTISLFGGGITGGPGLGGAAGAAAGGGLRALPRAVVYVLGIALMYSTLGVIAALTGGLFGGWLANPFVLGGIGLLLLAMALSMFGLYELQAPAEVLSKLGGAAGASLFGTFLAGLMVGVFAAPCVGPPIIALLAYVGAKGDPVFGFWAFFVLSLGLGLPYLVLGISTGLLSRLPRSGAWMEWVKHALGVVLLAVAAFYLCTAIAPRQVAWVPVLALGLGGLYLGFLEPTGRDRPAFRRFKWAVGVAGLAAATIVAFESPEIAALRGGGAAGAVTWQAFDEAALAQAKASGQPVVLDFSAEWCVPCHELDDRTFSDARVAGALAPFVKLKVDLTRFDSPASLALRKRFDIQGVPTIVFLGPDGSEVAEARSVGFVPPEALRAHAELARGGRVSARG